MITIPSELLTYNDLSYVIFNDLNKTEVISTYIEPLPSDFWDNL